MSVAVMEACPPELAHLERPEYGGSLFFSDHGIAGCPQCGWTGVPTIQNAVISSWCPVCHPVDVRVEVADALGLVVQRVASERQVPRNQPCPCGSGVKAKRCDCEEYTV